MSGDWYAETFGACPHGYVKPYCAQCAGDELEADLEAKREKRERKCAERVLIERRRAEEAGDR